MFWLVEWRHRSLVAPMWGSGRPQPVHRPDRSVRRDRRHEQIARTVDETGFAWPSPPIREQHGRPDDAEIIGPAGRGRDSGLAASHGIHDRGARVRDGQRRVRIRRRAWAKVGAGEPFDHKERAKAERDGGPVDRSIWTPVKEWEWLKAVDERDKKT